MKIFDVMVLLCTILAEVYMLWDFFDNFFSAKDNFVGKRKIYIIILTMFSIFIVNMIGNSYLNLVLSPIIYFVFSYILFDISFVNRIVYVFIAWMVLLFGEVIFVLILEVPAYVLKVSTVTNLANMTWFVFAVKLMSYLIFVVIKQLIKTSRHRMPAKIFWMYIFQPVVSIVIMIVTYYTNGSVEFSDSYKISMTVTFALLLFANILMFYAFNQYALQMSINMEQQVKLMKQKADEEYYTQVAEMNEKHRRFIHDIDNYFKTICVLAAEGDTDKIISIADEYIGEMQRSRGGIYCRHSVVNAIIGEKMQLAKSQGIEMDIVVSANREVLECVSDGDIVCIFGNLLDNAIRAASDCDEAYIKVRIYTKNDGKRLVVEIKNSYSKLLLKTDAGGGFLTTKSDKSRHGIGLKSVRYIVEKYNGLLICDAINNEFVALAEMDIKQ